MISIMLLGTAGSGKSTLTLTLSEWLKDHDRDTATLNLDPGVKWLPYAPDVDIRDYINLDEIMVKYELGPNGALVAAIDMMASHLLKIRKEIAELECDYLLIDTPGQMEIFAFRSTGPYIASKITNEKKVILCLIDSLFTKTPSDFISALLLATSVQYRFLSPQINVISKSDMLGIEEKEKIERWIEDPENLEIDTMNEQRVIQGQLSRNVANAIKEEILSDIIFTSSTTNEGIMDLFAMIERTTENIIE